MSFNVRIILDSIGPNGARLTTFEMTLPRIVLAEFNTHRLFSRNSASSRAIPVEKMLARVKEHPFVPEYWGKNQKGMQAEEELSAEMQENARRAWLNAMHWATGSAEMLKDYGVHKQLTNRLLEPFMWHTIVFTATELENFIALRADKHAAPEIRKPAEMLVDVYQASKPMELRAGEWHLPFVTFHDLRIRDGQWHQPFAEKQDDEIDWHFWAKISSARCARVSYLTHEGKRDLDEDMKLYERLIVPGHMSPLEHPAQALTRAQWEDCAEEMVKAWMRDRLPTGNFWGWMQFRKTIPFEHNAKMLREFAP